MDISNSHNLTLLTNTNFETKHEVYPFNGINYLDSHVVIDGPTHVKEYFTDINNIIFKNAIFEADEGINVKIIDRIELRNKGTSVLLLTDDFRKEARTEIRLNSSFSNPTFIDLNGNKNFLSPIIVIEKIEIGEPYEKIIIIISINAIDDLVVSLPILSYGYIKTRKGEYANDNTPKGIFEIAWVNLTEDDTPNDTVGNANWIIFCVISLTIFIIIVTLTVVFFLKSRKEKTGDENVLLTISKE